MSGATQTFKVRFGAHPTRVETPGVGGQGQRDAQGQTDEPGPTAAPRTRLSPDHAHPTARYLALAWRMEELFQDGTLADYAAAARWLGVTPARASMLSHLIHLAPDIQEAILLADCRASEHLLRPVCRMADWGEQRQAFKAVVAT